MMQIGLRLTHENSALNIEGGSTLRFVGTCTCTVLLGMEI